MAAPPAKKPRIESILLPADEKTALAAILMAFGLSRDEIGRALVESHPDITAYAAGATLRRLGIPDVAVGMVMGRLLKVEPVTFVVSYAHALRKKIRALISPEVTVGEVVEFVGDIFEESLTREERERRARNDETVERERREAVEIAEYERAHPDPTVVRFLGEWGADKRYEKEVESRRIFLEAFFAPRPRYDVVMWAVPDRLMTPDLADWIEDPNRMMFDRHGVFYAHGEYAEEAERDRKFLAAIQDMIAEKRSSVERL